MAMSKTMEVKSTAMDIKGLQEAPERLINGIACWDCPILIHKDQVALAANR